MMMCTVHVDVHCIMRTVHSRARARALGGGDIGGGGGGGGGASWGPREGSGGIRRPQKVLLDNCYVGMEEGAGDRGLDRAVVAMAG